MTYDERLDNLLSAAAKIFAAKGFHSTSMRDLSRAAGLSLAGIYHYVAGKDELLFTSRGVAFPRFSPAPSRPWRKARTPRTAWPASSGTT